MPFQSGHNKTRLPFHSAHSTVLDTASDGFEQIAEAHRGLDEHVVTVHRSLSVSVSRGWRPAGRRRQANVSLSAHAHAACRWGSSGAESLMWWTPVLRCALRPCRTPVTAGLVFFATRPRRGARKKKRECVDAIAPSLTPPPLPPPHFWLVLTAHL